MKLDKTTNWYFVTTTNPSLNSLLDFKESVYWLVESTEEILIKNIIPANHQEKEKNIDLVDIVLVIDISSSMLATDFKPNRLEVVKKTAKNFINKRKEDRLGILVFAGESFIQCPLTIDKDVLLSLMDEVSVAQQSYDGTAIGMAIANATNRLRNSASKSKVMILLSDGSNNSGELDPSTAADLAKQFNIKIYTIGAGTNDDVSFIPGRGYIRNEIDEKSLKAIAKKTGGQYFRATNSNALEKIYSKIDELERTEVEIKIYTQRIDCSTLAQNVGIA